MDDYQRRDGAVYPRALRVVGRPTYGGPLLVGPVAARMKELLGEVTSERDGNIEAVEIIADHVLLFVLVGPRDGASSVARAFNGRASRILRVEFPHLLTPTTRWSTSYFVSSVGRVFAATVTRYIEERTMRPAVGRS